jgi:predicted kinase
MACLLDKVDILALYSDIYENILVRINGEVTTKFNPEEYIKQLHNEIAEVNDPKFALEVAQAAPEIMLQVIATRKNVREYFVKNDISQDPISKKSIEFENINEVIKFVAVPQKTRQEIKDEIKEINKSSKDKPAAEPLDPNIQWSYNENNGAKIAYPLATVFQQAYAVNPETATEAEKNVKDPEKNLFYDVIKDIVMISKERPTDSDEIVYQDKSLALTAMKDSEFPADYLTRVDKTYLDKPEAQRGILAVITDTNGNYVYFKEDGSITEDPSQGRIVYQYLRKVNLIKGKLYLSSMSDKGGQYTLVPADVLAKREAKKMEDAGVEVSEEQVAEMTKQIADKQAKELNDLYRLREYILSDEGTSVILGINNGTFGINSSNTKTMTLEQAGINEADVANYEQISDKSKLDGQQFFMISKKKPGVEIDQKVFLQRGDMNEELANKIATILTTTAKLKGKELSPEERKTYFEVFINNSIKKGQTTNRDRITAKVTYRNRDLVLAVAINGEEIAQEDLYTEESKQKIINHLLNARPKEKIEGQFWPANIQYNKKYKDGNFIDYAISGETIKEVPTNYFQTIKPFIKIVYTLEADQYNNGLNAYLTYTIPNNIVPAGQPIFQPGMPQPKKSNAPVKVEAKKGEATAKYFGKFGDAKAAHNDNKGIWALRPSTGLDPVIPFDEHYGNPWDVTEDKLNKVKLVDTLEEAVQNYEDWLTGRKFKRTQQERRKWILQQVNSGALDNAELIYYHKNKTVKTHVHVLADMVNNRDKTKPEVIVEPKVTRTKEEKVAADKVINRVPSVLDILNQPSQTLFKREKLRQSFLDRIFTSKSDLKKAEDWWNNSGLSKIKVDGKVLLPLEKITEIVNSDAFATFTQHGITLYEADGGTAIDVYHEAWHGFSQLVLTSEQKTKLYDELRTYPKWADAEYFDIEEDIAEDFRSFMKSKKKFSGYLGKIFDAIANALRNLYGRITRQDMTRPRDIASVREYFDLLYQSDKNPDVFQQFNSSVNNLMFTKLNRAKTIQPVKSMAKNYADFTVEETNKTVRLLDNMIGIAFQNYNRDNNTSNGAIRILGNPQNRNLLYRDLRDRLEMIRTRYAEAYEKVFFENEESENPDLFLQKDIEDKMLYFAKLVDNFGDIDLVLKGKQKRGVVAHHIKKSKFSALKESYADLTEDPTDLDKSQMSKLDGGNTISSKDIASEETMMLLSSIFKAVRNKDGEIEQVTDEFGIPQLEDPNNMWNRLAKILEGSFDETEMYKRIVESSNNYPELQQLQNLLPNPYSSESAVLGDYKTVSEFDTETKFWQDLKKPRINYIQLNLNKETKEDKGTSYEARLSKANFDVYKVISDWSFNFVTADVSVNPYVQEDAYGRNMLNIDKLLQKFGNKDLLNSKESIEFLNALGIHLDTSSPAIMSIINSKTQLFSNRFGINRMLNVIKQINKSTDEGAINVFRRSPLTQFLKGLEYDLRVDKTQTDEMQGRIRVLAELQNLYSDSYSNFSVLSPERNRVWEHFLDSTITRVITSLRKAENWQDLTRDAADPNGLFKHMRWLSEDNNTFSPFSKLLSSVFDLDPLSPNYGNKKEGSNILLNNVAGTQLVGKSYDETTGISTASMDATSKFLQEFNTMLLNGIEEFMRHASKNTSMGITITDKIVTYPGKSSDKLYIDIEAFKPGSFGETKGFDIMAGYLSGEANRIFRFDSDKTKFAKFAGYNREVRRKDGRIVMAGQAFTAFDDVLSTNVQKELYAIIDNAVKNKQADFNMMDVLDQDIDLRDRVEADVKSYFNKQTNKNQERLNKARYVDASLVQKADPKYIDLTATEVDNILVKAYTYNSWIHKFETAILAYGDLVQYNHDKEEFHKRNAGLGSGGRSFRADLRAQAFVNNQTLFKRYYADKMGYQTRKYDGTLHTAIIKEVEIPSKMYDEYHKELEETYFKRLGDRTEAKKLADTTMKEYKSMKIGDGQGHIGFETYRMLKRLEGNWSDAQEMLYRKVSLGENVSLENVIEYFPPYKLQYYGNIQTTGLPLTSFHKFSLAPIIPGVAKKGTPLYDLHQKMMDQKIDYVLFESGSKVGHIGFGDEILNADGSFNQDVEFTTNVVFAEYLKNQTEVNQSYKKKSIFSTQMRKLVLEGLYEQGVIDTTNEDKITQPIVKKYLNDVSEYTELLKTELLEEIGYDQVSPNEYVPRDKNSMQKLVTIIRENLEREDLLSDDLIDFIDVYDATGELVHDLSLHPESAKIEKLLLSMINKRIIKQKVKGEPLVQVSSALYENTFRAPANLRGATEEEKKKWNASNLLPTYYRKADGKTAAMKVMISMQGDYYSLFNLEYQNGETIGLFNAEGIIDMDRSLARLNEKIKDDAWLDADNGANRKAITMVGVRIPVQGLNSMEFMEIFEFLAPQAGNIIIPPAEIVAKSGGDFDIDKLTIFMTNLNSEGKIKQKIYADNSEIKGAISELRESEESVTELLKAQKAGLENELIEDIKNILELPQNYASLITPNGTFLLKSIAEELSEYVMDYNPFENMMSEDTNLSKDNKKVISPTRVLETLYNVYKHESNIVGKKTLGLGAIENTFNVIMNAAGFYMPAEFGPGDQLRKSLLFLRHNKTTDPTGKEVISISNRFDIDNKNKVADVISQMMNGWVDVEKDAWVFFIQGNYEVAPVLLYLIKAGVPAREAIYFVSNPLVRDYVNEQRAAKSTFADVLGKKPDSPNFAKYQAASEVIVKNFKSDVLGKYSKNYDRYTKGIELTEEVLESRPESKKHFTEKEMLDIIIDYKNDDLTDDQVKLSQAMFLHYLQIENQIGGLTQLKMNMNPDTSTESTLSDVERTESNIDNLMFDNRIPRELLTTLMTDSVISSFFNGPLALAVSRPLFKLRYHKAISDYLIVKGQTLREASESTFGENKVDTFINTFRNDIVSFIFQNALRRYKLGDTYMSYNLKTEVPVKYASELKRGAFVKAETDGTKTLYVDEKQLREEFKSKAWVKNSDVENSYQDRGLYPLDIAAFMRKKSLNFNQYLRFVAEREYLRSEFPISEVSETKYFKSQMKAVKQVNPDLANEKVARFTYEKYIAEKALYNTFNIHYMFKNKDTALAVQYSDILLNNKNLADKYRVLNFLMLDSNQDDSTFNVYLSDKDMNNEKATEYTQNLAELSDPQVKKVSDPEENARISDVFSRLSLFAFMQTGLNKSKLSFTSIVNYDDFLAVVEKESEMFQKALDQNGNAILDSFFDLFMEQNNMYNQDKNRYKDYLSTLDYGNLDKVTGLTATTEKRRSAQAKADVILPIGTSGSGKSTFIKSLPQENLVVIEPDAMRVEFTGDINNKSKDKEIYIEAANRAIKAIKQGKQVVFDTTNLTKEKRRPFIEAIKKAIPGVNIQYKLMELNPELAKQRIKKQLARGEKRAAVSDETIDRHAASYKQMLKDIKEEGITEYTQTIAQPAEVKRTDKIILRTEVKENPNTLYLFGDNDVRKGYGGQAKEMRGEPNTIGISTKKLPARTEEAYKTDKDLDINKKIITADINKAITEWNTGKYNRLVIPQMGVGLAELPTRAPKTYEFLQQELTRLENSISNVTTSEEVTAEPVAFQRFGLRETTNNDIFTYNDKGAGRQYYEQITNRNEDVVFVHNIAISEIKSNFLKSFGGQSNFVKDAPDMTINIPTSFNTAGDNFASVDPEIYKSITDLFERRIDSLKDLLASNVKIAFPETGFGDPAKMPQELFVYLSKRLYQEFGYLNPGSTVYEELREIVGKTQGITDEEILQQLGLEEDPFKC